MDLRVRRLGVSRASVVVMSILSLSAASPDAVHRAPNVLVVLIDDAGFGQAGTFGGPIPTPTLDSLAVRGLRYNQFHVMALCSPTRAALLTGRNAHAVGMGTISNWSVDQPGYNAVIPRSAAFVSEILRGNGYATAAIGKWHLIPDPETTLAGPFDHWPTRQGFDYYYGFLGGETDQWRPELVEGTHPLEMQPPPGRENDYTLNEDLASPSEAAPGTPTCSRTTPPRHSPPHGGRANSLAHRPRFAYAPAQLCWQRSSKG